MIYGIFKNSHTCLCKYLYILPMKVDCIHEISDFLQCLWGTKERSENGWYSEYLVRPVSGLGTGQGNLGRDTERQLSGLLRHGRCIQEVTLGRSWRIVSAFYCNMGSKTIGEASLQTQDLLGGGNSLYEWDSVKLLLTLSLQSEIKNSVGVRGCGANSRPASSYLETLCVCNRFDSCQWPWVVDIVSPAVWIGHKSQGVEVTIPKTHAYNIGPRIGRHTALAPKAVLHLQSRTFSASSTSGCQHSERGNRNKNKCGYDDGYRGWVQEEKGTTEDEMAGWHHWLDGHEFEWTPGDGDGQGGLACCYSWGCKESDTTERLNWTEQRLMI